MWGRRVTSAHTPAVIPAERALTREGRNPVLRSGSTIYAGRWVLGPGSARARRSRARLAGTTTTCDSPALEGEGGTERLAGSYAIRLLLTLTLLPLVGAPADAGDVAAGRRKALQCQACHGLDGLSKLPDAPHLAGQPAPYLIKSLDEYRTGARKHEMMILAVKNLSDQDIADLAAYYAAIEISVKPPQ
jgi:cytochrome c553